MSISIETLSKYINPWFVETGTLYGDTVGLAIQCGFGQIYSIEYFADYYEKAKRRFPEVKVHLFNGDSSKDLWNVIKDIPEGKVTYFLDAHGTEAKSDGFPNPILKEIEQISRHPSRNSVIMVDDARLFGISPNFTDCTELNIKREVLKINSNYQFCYEDGFQKDDILVAYVPES